MRRAPRLRLAAVSLLCGLAVAGCARDGGGGDAGGDAVKKLPLERETLRRLDAGPADAGVGTQRMTPPTNQAPKPGPRPK